MRSQATGAERLGGKLKAIADHGLYALFRCLPTDVVSDIGAHIALMRGPTAYARGHARSLANMKRLRPELSDEEVSKAAMSRWDNVGRLTTEFAVLDRLMAEGRVTFDGLPYVDQAKTLAGGRGFMMLGLHLGNWEIWSPVLAHLGLPANAFYEPPASRSRDSISRKVRARLGVNLVAPELVDVRPAVRALAAGEHLAVFADESPQGVVRAPFFGRPPDLGGNLANIVRFARFTKTIITPGYALRTSRARFHIVILPPIVLEPETTPGERLLEDVQRLNDLNHPACGPVVLSA
jgi:KDO2-lipid IV(A) lauroyltransferase